MELEGRKGLVDTGKSSCMWSVLTVSLGLAILNVFQGLFGPEMAVFGPKLQFLPISRVLLAACCLLLLMMLLLNLVGPP